MSTPKNCPGCGGPLREVGAVSFMKTRCCGDLSYAICPSCARTMVEATQAERTALIQKIEMSLAAAEELPQ